MMMKKLVLLLVIATAVLAGGASAFPQSWNLQCTGHTGHITLHGDKSADATLDGRGYSFIWSIDETTGDGEARWLFWTEKFHYDGNVITSDFIPGCSLVPDSTAQVEQQATSSFLGIFEFS